MGVATRPAGRHRDLQSRRGARRGVGTQGCCLSRSLGRPHLRLLTLRARGQPPVIRILSGATPRRTQRALGASPLLGARARARSSARRGRAGAFRHRRQSVVAVGRPPPRIGRLAKAGRGGVHGRRLPRRGASRGGGGGDAAIHIDAPALTQTLDRVTAFDDVGCSHSVSQAVRTCNMQVL